MLRKGAANPLRRIGGDHPFPIVSIEETHRLLRRWGRLGSGSAGAR